VSRDLNRCEFIGRLGQDPETRYMPNGSAVTNITIAVGDDYKDKQGNKVEQTEWVRVSAFQNLAEVMGKYLKKGSKVYIAGKMKTRAICTCWIARTMWPRQSVTRHRRMVRRHPTTSTKKYLFRGDHENLFQVSC
jgi:single stranded DNA-binding protein